MGSANCVTKTVPFDCVCVKCGLRKASGVIMSKAANVTLHKLMLCCKCRANEWMIERRRERKKKAKEAK